MSETLAYLNGRFLPESEAAVSFYDVGFLMGATVTERLRTFHGRLFQLDRHLERLDRSLQIVGIHLPVSHDELIGAAEELVGQNHRLLDPGDDLNLSLFVTPGVSPTLSASQLSEPTIGMHTMPLPFGQWAAGYERGEALIVSGIRHLPADCLPPELKCRSRMHFYLADRDARSSQPGARALLLDHQGLVAETSTANVLMVDADKGISSPPEEKVLPGTSIAMLKELAEAMSLSWQHRELSVADLLAADEVMLTSTSPCLLPVCSVDRKPIGDGRPGVVYRQLLKSWSDFVGLDIQRQALQFAQRKDRVGAGRRRGDNE